MLMNPRVLIFLVVLYFVYMVVGAAVFMAMERPFEIQRCDEAKAAKKMWLERTNENTNLDEDLLNDFIVNVTRFAGFGISLQGEVKCPINWDFQSSLFFTGTIITTIGYGNLAPVLWYSQIFCIIYALVGIPLFAIMFSGLGQYISELVKRFLTKFDDTSTAASSKEKDIVYSVFSFIIIVGGSLVIFQLIPAIIFTFVEGWSYRESFYFCFITLTTIGFGDFVVGANPEKSYVALYRVMVLFWILFGLAYTFTAINLIVQIFRKSCLQSPLAKCCVKNWEDAEEEVFSEAESLLGVGSIDEENGDDNVADSIVRPSGDPAIGIDERSTAPATGPGLTANTNHALDAPAQPPGESTEHH